MKIKSLALPFISIMFGANAFSQTSSIGSGSFSDGGLRYNWTLKQTLVPETFTNSDVHQILGITGLPQGADFNQYYQAYSANLSGGTYKNTKNGAELSPFLIDNGILSAFSDESDRTNYINNNIVAYSGGSYTAKDAGLILVNGWFRTNPNSDSEITVFQAPSPGFEVGRQLFALDDPWFYWYAMSAVYAPSPEDTRASFLPNALALRSAFNVQSAKIALGLGYDCKVYDEKNICVSFAGANSDGKGVDATTGTLIIAHKLTKNFRFGGYIDQSFGSSASGNLTAKNGSPGFGAFALWTQNADDFGVQVRAAANVSKVDIETTREQIESAEAGFGISNVKSTGFQIEVSKNYAINNMWSARPYVGYRKAANTRAGYTEQASGDVTAPLTYGRLKQNTETLFTGATFAHAVSAKTTMFLTAGIEHDLKTRIGNYEALNDAIGDIESIDLSLNKLKTRPTLSFALNHEIDKTQRIGVSLTHRKEVFASGSTTSAFLQYSKGF